MTAGTKCHPGVIYELTDLFVVVLRVSSHQRTFVSTGLVV